MEKHLVRHAPAAHRHNQHISIIVRTRTTTKTMKRKRKLNINITTQQHALRSSATKQHNAQRHKDLGLSATKQDSAQRAHIPPQCRTYSPACTTQTHHRRRPTFDHIARTDFRTATAGASKLRNGWCGTRLQQAPPTHLDSNENTERNETKNNPPPPRKQ